MGLQSYLPQTAIARSCRTASWPRSRAPSAEALEASLLAHVVDASDPAFERQLEVTTEVLAEIGADDMPRLLVFNRIDRLRDEVALEAGGGCAVGALARRLCHVG